MAKDIGVAETEAAAERERVGVAVRRTGREKIIEITWLPDPGSPPGKFADEKTVLRLPVALYPELKRKVCALEQEIDSGEDTPDGSLEMVHFAHKSEKELADILTFYRIEWEYEPHMYPVRWNDDGEVIESFTPDFYLPEQDLYIELTDLKQSLVTRKNRKVRLFREHYPEKKIKIFYRRDYRSLVQKYRLDKKESPK